MCCIVLLVCKARLCYTLRFWGMLRKRGVMEFLGFMAVFVVVCLLFFKPACEKLAFGIFVVAWLVELVMFVAHTSNFFPNVNL